MSDESAPFKITDELDAMKLVSEALDPLPTESRIRVVRWAAEWCGLANDIGMKVQEASSPDNQAEEEMKPTENFSDLPDFYSHISPKATWEKVLAASYWIQKAHGDQDFASRLVSKELNNLGDGVSNITHAMSSLIGKKFVIQTRKSGSSKQAQKLYKVTVKGKKYVEDLMG